MHEQFKIILENHVVLCKPVVLMFSSCHYNETSKVSTGAVGTCEVDSSDVSCRCR